MHESVSDLPTRFLRYDPSELRGLAARWTRELTTLRPLLGAANDPAVWDELALDWWAARCSERARVDARPALGHLTQALYEEIEWPARRTVSRRGLVDLAHVSHPPFEPEGGPFAYAYWRQALSRERLEVLLAAQLEWGGGGRPAGRYGRVMLAASDLCGLDARAKAICFATDDEAERRRLVSDLEALRLASWDTRPWLWLDVPWRADPEEHPPAWGLLEG